jgi:hypothetical protein
VLATGAQGTDTGDTRTIRLRDGATLKERLIELDDAAHRFTYSVLDGQLPLKAHVSTVTMSPVGTSLTEVRWIASFEPGGAPAAALAQAVREGVLEFGLEGLAQRVREEPCSDA